MRFFVRIAVFLIFILGGCGDRQSDFATIPPQSPASTTASMVAPFASNSYTLGNLDGTLASALEASLQKNEAFSTQTSEGPIIFSNDTLDQQGPEVLAALVRAYSDGRPIVMMQPDEAEVNALRSALGLGEGYLLPTGLPEGKQYAEAVAFDLEEDGDLFTLEIYPPNESGPDLFEFPAQDGPEDQAKRIEILLNWLRDDQTRISTVSENDISLSPKDLQALAQAQVDSKVFTHRKAIYQVTHYIYACHSFTDPNAVDSDWFYVQQSCQNNYSGGYSKIEDIPISGGRRASAGLYGGTFKTDSWFVNQDNGSQNVLLAANTPENANNVATITSGVSYAFGGTVGFRGALPTGGVSSGVTVNSSKSFSVSDCEVVNNSASRFINAQWTYIFKKVEGIRFIFYAGLADPPILSRTNFQPVNQWIWRVSPAVRNNPANQVFRTKLDTTTIGSSGGTVDGPFIGQGPFHADYDYTWEFSTPLRYPPVLIAPASLNFGSEASFQTMDFSASQDWTITSDQPWCTTTPSSGSASLTRTNVTCEENSTGADRSAILTITSPANQGSTKVQIFQSRFSS